MNLYNIVTGTRKNRTIDKPNEDFFFSSEEAKLFVIADGITRDRENGVYPNPSPSREAAQKFCKIVGGIIETNSGLPSLKVAFINANNEIKKLNKDYQGYFLPGTVGIAVLIKERILCFASIGDCIGIILRNGEKIRFNRKQTEALRNCGQKISPEVIRMNICNNKNHSLGFGAFNGDVNAVDFIEDGMINLENGDKVILISDGLEILLENYDIAEVMTKNTIEEVFDLVENIESNLGLRTDDKTAIIFDVKV